MLSSESGVFSDTLKVDRNRFFILRLSVLSVKDLYDEDLAELTLLIKKEKFSHGIHPIKCELYRRHKTETLMANFLTNVRN